MAAAVDSISDARRMRAAAPELPVLLIRTEGSEELVIEAWRMGCRGYIRAEHLEADLTNALARVVGAAPAPAVADESEDETLIGEGHAMRSVRAWARRVGASPSNVLITGETGTGKELVAELIHRSSDRRHKPLVCINCAALPDALIESELFGHERGAFTGAVSARDGKLQLASGGTLFLDEIGEMGMAAQAKILRCIETRRVQRLGGAREMAVDIRIIAATNRPPETLASGDGFRPDLYYRLSVAHIKLPPLRDRREDVPVLARRFVAEFNGKFRRDVRSISPRSLRWMTGYHWPGNVRELRNAIEAAFINLPPADRELHLPQAVEQRLAGTLEAEGEAESGILLRTLLASNWNKSKTAKALNWSRMTLYRKMEKYQLTARPVRTGAAS
jgi:DNA-binding NtrC family response regulator